ncbi:uncharacterized protein LOC109598901 [Aethina tumida]|uniref:uncharacterized protein LOC109598901 n=1 Tax=Aethina tumida TaxID=116153 RepID=UPI00096ADB01|nr:uncharacterized protein LOC109598901 [Aethina tumida]
MSDDEVVKTVAPDARYHNCNVTNWCYASFVDYQKCKILLGDVNPSCDEFKKIFQSICPNAWIQKWEEQIDNGTFAAPLPSKKDCD